MMNKKTVNEDRNNYPEALKALPIWVVWRKENRDGRTTKMPYMAEQPEKRAKSDDSTTWSDFDTAWEAYETLGNEMDGVGIMLKKEYNLIFIDIDHCIIRHESDETDVPVEEFDDRAAYAMKLFQNQYIERSQSGEGLHIILRGEIPKSFRNAEMNVECYSEKRYCAMTGDIISFHEPSEAPGALLEFYEKYKTTKKEASVKQAAPKEKRPVSGDEALIRKARDSSKKFSLLYDGEWEDAGFESQSEADCSLCTMLAYRTGGDYARIDELFSESGLYRDKWERQDYKDRTIRAAIAYYEEQKDLKDEDFGGEGARTGYLRYEDILERVMKCDPARSPKYKKYDDIAIAKLFSDIFYDCVLYNPDAGQYFTYDGVKWSLDKERLETSSYMKQLARALQAYSVWESDAGFTKCVLKLSTINYRKRVIEDAKDIRYKRYAEFDRQPYLFNCQNCVIDLRSGTKIEHRPDFYLSKVSNVVYDPDADGALFKKFLSEVMEGNERLLQYLQDILGYTLCGGNPRDEFYILYGSSTRNGKTTLNGTIQHLMGEYGQNVDPDTLANKIRNSAAPSVDLARLEGARFLNCAETRKNMELNEALLKGMTGSGTISARNCYEGIREFTPGFKLFLDTNHLPIIHDRTLFDSDRIKVIPFNRHFAPEERDAMLKTKLKKRSAISGVFNWMLEGAKRYYASKGDITMPMEVKQAIEDYEYRTDIIAPFIDEMLEETEGKNCAVADVYRLYEKWCAQQGYPCCKKDVLRRYLVRKGIFGERGNAVRYNEAGESQEEKSVRNIILNHTIRTAA